MTTHRKLTVLLVAATSALAPASAFAADSPTDAVYKPESGVLGVVATPTPTATAAPETTATPKPEAPETEATPVATPTQTTEKASTGDLPFTGFEAGFVSLAGIALLGGGFALRRLSRDAS